MIIITNYNTVHVKRKNANIDLNEETSTSHKVLYLHHINELVKVVGLVINTSSMCRKLTSGYPDLQKPRTGRKNYGTLMSHRGIPPPPPPVYVIVTISVCHLYVSYREPFNIHLNFRPGVQFLLSRSGKLRHQVKHLDVCG